MSHQTETILKLEDKQWTSLYIPMIPNGMLLEGKPFESEEDIKDFLKNKLKIGKVSRIDFITKMINNEPVRQAYIHMDHWYDNEDTHIIRNMIDTNGSTNITGYAIYPEAFNYTQRPITVSFTSSTFTRKLPFIKFKVNWNVIPSVDEELNVHQLVAKTKRQQEIIDEQAKLIKELNQMITTLKEDCV